MAASRLLLLSLVLAVACAVVPTGLRGNKGLDLHQDDPKKEPADSEMIEGPDCGHASKILGKWNKAKNVGTAAGAAQAAIGQAEKAAETVTDAVDEAKDIGEVIADAFGKDDYTTLPEFGQPREDAKEASEKATGAATDLEVKLGTVKDEIAGADMAGAGVKDKDVAELKELTKKTEEAAKDAQHAAEGYLKRAYSAKAAAMKNGEAAMKMMDKVVEASEPVLADAKEFGQKAKWAANDAGDMMDKADAANEKLDKKIEDAGDQKPVVEAQKEKVTGQKEGVSEAKDGVEEAIETLKTNSGELEEAYKPLKEAAGKGVATASGIAVMTEQILKAEESLAKTEESLSTLKAKVATMMKRVGALKKEIK